MFSTEIYARMGMEEDGVEDDELTIAFPEFDNTLPRPGPSEFENKAVMGTIVANPDLFQIPVVVKINHLQSLLQWHPNQPLVQSVVTSLREGFWPWADT